MQICSIDPQMIAKEVSPRFDEARPPRPEKESSMPKYVVERDISGAGNLSRDELREISQLSCRVLSKLGSEIQWIESYVTGEKIYCIDRANNDALIKEHAERGGFPANRISVIATVIDPTTPEACSTSLVKFAANSCSPKRRDL
jgi:hypothetical protein